MMYGINLESEELVLEFILLHEESDNI